MMMFSRILAIFIFALLALVNAQAPIEPPVTAPIEAPVAVPVEAPVTAPVEAPVAAPVAPVAAPAFAPTRRRFPMFFKKFQMAPNGAPVETGPRSPNASPRAQAPTRRRFPFGMQLRN